LFLFLGINPGSSIFLTDPECLADQRKVKRA